METEYRDLLIRDLCARLPYKPIILVNNGKYLEDMVLDTFILNDIDGWEPKPYLRLISTMTDEEKTEINSIIKEFGNKWFNAEESDGRWAATFWECVEIIDYLNSHYIDYRGLIKRNLAIEAPEGMYNKLK